MATHPPPILRCASTPCISAICRAHCLCTGRHLRREGCRNTVIPRLDFLGGPSVISREVYCYPPALWSPCNCRWHRGGVESTTRVLRLDIRECLIPVAYSGAYDIV